MSSTMQEAGLLRVEVLRLAAQAAYQHPHGGANPACVPGAPNATAIAREVGVTRARVQQILAEARAERTKRRKPASAAQ